MILSKHAFIKISPRNFKYWKDRGYFLSQTGGRRGKNTGQRIKVNITELAPKSNVRVACKCDECGIKYTRRFSQGTDICYVCYSKKRATGNDWGSKNRGKIYLNMRGENHPRWNLNKTDFMEYARKVRYLSEQEYKKHIDWINPNRLSRRLCGVEDGYQLDHKISIKQAFILGIVPELVSKFHNLQLLKWKTNLSKGCGAKYSHQTFHKDDEKR